MFMHWPQKIISNWTWDVFPERERRDPKRPVFLLQNFILISHLKCFGFSFICLSCKHNSSFIRRTYLSVRHSFQTPHRFICRMYPKTEDEGNHAALLPLNVFSSWSWFAVQGLPKSQIKIPAPNTWSRVPSSEFIQLLCKYTKFFCRSWSTYNIL